MGVKDSEGVVPLTDFKINPGPVVRQAADAHRPVPLTSQGRGEAILQSVSEFDKAEGQPAVMRAGGERLADLEEGRAASLVEAKAGFGRK